MCFIIFRLPIASMLTFRKRWLHLLLLLIQSKIFSSLETRNVRPHCLWSRLRAYLLVELASRGVLGLFPFTVSPVIRISTRHFAIHLSACYSSLCVLGWPLAKQVSEKKKRRGLIKLRLVKAFWGYHSQISFSRWPACLSVPLFVMWFLFQLRTLLTAAYPTHRSSPLHLSRSPN